MKSKSKVQKQDGVLIDRIEFDANAIDVLTKVHQDSEALRAFFGRIKEKVGIKESLARFELDPSTGLVSVKVFDSETGVLHLRLSLEQVEAGLKNLDETQDNESPLSTFFLPA